MTSDSYDTMTCDCCGGSLPMLVWEALRNGGADCTGSVDADGRCRSFDRHDWRLNDMATILRCHGSISGDVVAEAQSWLDHDFTPAQAGRWCEIGVWDSETAAEFRDGGLALGRSHRHPRRKPR